MVKYYQNIYIPKNPGKYIGDHQPFYRSGWEQHVMKHFDTSPAVLFWASESLRIPYINPFTKKLSNYYPDFLVCYIDKKGDQHKEVVEVKPLKETMMENAKSTRDKLVVALNLCKWSAAKKFCRAHGMTFRVITEKDIFDHF